MMKRFDMETWDGISAWRRSTTRYIFTFLESERTNLEWSDLISDKYQEGYVLLKRCLKRWYTLWGNDLPNIRFKAPYKDLMLSYGLSHSISEWRKIKVHDMAIALGYMYADIGAAFILDNLKLPDYVYLIAMFDVLGELYGTIPEIN